MSGSGSSKKCFPIKQYLQGSQSDINTDTYKQVANEFNSYFFSVRYSLALSIDSGGEPIIRDEDYETLSDFTLRTVTGYDITRYTNSLRGSSAPGCDGISASLLKDNIDLNFNILAHGL